MASFTEQATLIVRDKSTSEINKINAALKKLFATANQLKSLKIDLGLNARGLTQAQVREEPAGTFEGRERGSSPTRRNMISRNARTKFRISRARIVRVRRTRAAM